MRQLSRIGWQRGGLGLFVIGLVILGVIRLTAEDPEIALMLGEPWEDMRQRSSAEIDPAIPGEIWGRLPKSDARLRFIDPKYGFVTPLARYFTIGFVNEQVLNVRMSPQIEPLLLDDTLKVVLDLQEQWREGGWEPIRLRSNPPFADTPEWRAQLRNVDRGGTSYWWAGDQYQVMLGVGRFKDYRNATEERYLITLELARPWGQP
ncbi:hypothetical protein HX799_00690 [Pseudomonas tolaasii]|uniref:hypothetical protein n=1 Tax=Pseudomonas tolaasii TaxID=29442 RepID=UPI0015A09629|nr:hypothetical protein [Pseudomonas tolaasii]NWC26468.1 hypothetical protein [Pseudomonas tolaasii]NWC49672.1 hypothetical protein [Pseudomonas tolaasii]NWE63604.1 hypothetical protein [Pseudomonas tolaasii]